MDAVRDIATTPHGRRCAVGSFERTVAVWDIVACKKLAEFDTVLDFGGRRLAITPDGNRVIAGAYERYGIAAYEATSGRELWRRKDLKKVQRIAVSPDSKHVCCGFDRRSEHVLSVATGETRAKLPGVQNVRFSPFAQLAMYDLKCKPAELRGPGRAVQGRIPRTTFAFLGAAFAPELLVTSESTGPIRCFRTSDAAETWRYVPTPGIHALSVCYDPTGGTFGAVFWSFCAGGPQTLARFDPATGRLLSEIAIPSQGEHAFCLMGTRLLTCDGLLLDSATGAVVDRLPVTDGAGK